MESSIAVFLLRQPACERLPTIPHRGLTKPTAAAKPPDLRNETEDVIRTRAATHKIARHAYVQAALHQLVSTAPSRAQQPARISPPMTTIAPKKGLRDRNSP